MREDTFVSWLKGRWRHIAGGIAGAVVILIITALIASRGSEVKWQSEALWPATAGTATSGVLPIAAFTYDQSLARQVMLPGVKVTLYQYAGDEPDWSPELLASIHAVDSHVTELWRGETGADGAVVAPLPAQRELMERERAARPDANATQTRLAIVLEHQGERRVEVRPLSFMQGNQLELLMDRPLYQPGQVIKLRALMVDADTGAPQAGELRWRARDPRGNLVMDETTRGSGAGISALELALAPQATQGEYTIEVEGGGASTSRRVSVQPFRLPAFTVTVSPLAAQIEPMAGASGQIVAAYTSGEPVRGADVEIIVRGQTQAMGFGVEEMTGKTDEQGRMAWSWAPTGGFAPGGALEISARVVTEAGRAEAGGGQVFISGGQPSMELIPAERGFFAAGLSNRGWLIIRDGSGAPVADAKVVVYVPEQTGETRQELRTDSAGRLELVWRAARTEVPLSIEVAMPGVANPLRQNLSVPYRSGGGVFVSGALSAGAGEALRVPLSPGAEPRHVLAVWQGRPIAHAAIAPSGAEAALNIPRWATGLIVLIALGQTMQQLDTQPMWVAQPGGDVVSIVPDREVAAPGEQARVKLKFGVGEGSAANKETSTTFALVGVDEALYALREREDVDGYVERLRRMPGGLSKTIAAGVAAGGDERGQAIARARFERAVVDSSPQWDAQHGNDRTWDLQRLMRDPARRGWGLLMALAMLALACVGGWSTVRSMSWEAFGFKRLAAMAGVGLLMVPPVVLLGALDHRGAGLMGGALVWLWVVLGWVGGAAWGLREHAQLGRWMGGLVGGAFFGVLVAVMLDSLYVTAWAETAAGVLAGLSALALGLGLILWPMILMHHKRWHAALGLATFGGGLLLAPFTLMLSRSVRYDMAPGSMEKVAMEAPMPMAAAPMAQATSEEMMDAKPRLEPMAEGEPAEAPGPRVRSYFPETMIWAPEVAGNAAGEAEVAFEVPDSITTWRLNAWSSTSDGRFGTGQASLRVWQRFFVDIDQPTQLTEGDVAELPVTLVNNGDAPVTAQLVAEVARGQLAIVGAPPASVTVAARSRVVLKMRVRAAGVGPAALRLVARVGDDAKAGDAVERPVMIVPDGRVLAASQAGLVQSQWEGAATLPAETIAGTGRADLRVFPGVEAAAMEGLDAMLRQPGGCFEQSSSATYPNILILETLRQIKPEAWPEGPERWAEANAKALKLSKLGYQRMLTFQRPSGGFALYPEGATSETVMLTAYGIMQLTELSRVIAVDPEVSRRAGRWLINQMTPQGRWSAWANGVSGSMAQSADIGQVRATAWIAGSLASSPHREEFLPRLKPALDYIVERHTAVEDPQAMALGAWALATAGRKDDAKKLTARLAATVQRDGDQAWWGDKVGTWMGGWGRWADLETTAIVAWALLTLEDQAELIPPAFTYLARQRSPWGGWGSTQSTVWALRAMAALRARGAAQDARLTVQLDDQALAQASGRGEAGVVEVRGGQPVVHHLSTGDTLGAGAHRARITASARTTAIAQLTTTWAVPWSSPGARVEGERLEISVGELPRRARFAQDVAARVIVRNTGGLALGALIVELPLAPGAFAPREGLDAMVRAGEVDHYEVLPTHVRLYVSGMPANGQRAFTWRFTPLVRGAFSYPALRAYAFYAPEPVTERNGGELVVE